jgi:hypothetical protein
LPSDNHTIFDTLYANNDGSYRLRKIRTGIFEESGAVINSIKSSKERTKSVAAHDRREGEVAVGRDGEDVNRQRRRVDSRA